MEEIALVVLLINTELSDEASWHLYDEGGLDRGDLKLVLEVLV